MGEFGLPVAAVLPSEALGCLVSAGEFDGPPAVLSASCKACRTPSRFLRKTRSTYRLPNAWGSDPFRGGEMPSSRIIAAAAGSPREISAVRRGYEAITYKLALLVVLRLLINDSSPSAYPALHLIPQYALPTTVIPAEGTSVWGGSLRRAAPDAKGGKRSFRHTAAGAKSRRKRSSSPTRLPNRVADQPDMTSGVNGV